MKESGLWRLWKSRSKNRMYTEGKQSGDWYFSHFPVSSLFMSSSWPQLVAWIKRKLSSVIISQGLCMLEVSKNLLKSLRSVQNTGFSSKCSSYQKSSLAQFFNWFSLVRLKSLSQRLTQKQHGVYPLHETLNCSLSICSTVEMNLVSRIH